MSLSSKDIINIIKESGTETYNEHYKHSSFIVHYEAVITDHLIEVWKDEYDLNSYKGMKFSASGLWDTTYGLELDEWWIEEPITVHVPEQIIPAHDIIEWERIGD